MRREYAWEQHGVGNLRNVLLYLQQLYPIDEDALWRQLGESAQFRELGLDYEVCVVKLAKLKNESVT